MQNLTNFIEQNKKLFEHKSLDNSNLKAVKYLYCDNPTVEIYFKGRWYIIMKDEIREKEDPIYYSALIYTENKKVKNPPQELLHFQKEICW